MKNQYSIELLFKEMLTIQQSGITLSFDENVELLKKYQQLHKAEISQAYDDGAADQSVWEYTGCKDFDKIGEQYYTEKYEQNKTNQI